MTQSLYDMARDMSDDELRNWAENGSIPKKNAAHKEINRRKEVEAEAIAERRHKELVGVREKAIWISVLALWISFCALFRA